MQLICCSPPRPHYRFALAVLLVVCSFPALGQLVPDGGTKVINGTTATVTSDLNVGVNSGLTTLIITNGGVVNVSGNSTIGVNAGSSGNRVQVIGINSLWYTGAGDLTVGSIGGGNQIRAEAGGFISSSDCYIGSGADANTAVITGGAVWTNATALFVGESGAQNTVVVSNGAAIFSQTGWLGYSSSSVGNLVRVTGAGSAWSNSDSFFVGYNGSDCQLVVSNGAVLQDWLGFVGRNPTSTNNVAVVTGPNSRWRSDWALFVGDGSTGNRLIVTNGATVSAGTNLVIGTIPMATNNQIRIEGANVIATNAGRTATFEVRRGTNVFNGGLMDVDSLLMPNPGAAFVFNSGELRITQSQVSNAAPFIVGNGAPGALLTLRGGTNTFASGLIISSNATLSGCGAINGVVVNYGTILSTCAGGTLTFGSAVTNYNTITVTNGGQIQFLGPVVNFGAINTGPAPPVPVLHFTKLSSTNSSCSWSTNFSRYHLEYNQNLATHNWAASLRVPVLSGTNFVVTNSMLVGKKFYRLSSLPAPYIPPRPVLSIQRVLPVMVRLSWPADDERPFTLQYSTNLSRTNWAPSLSTQAVVGTNYVVTETRSGVARFYRLVAQ
jgi:T5SS/PEP-CTERM-associated repeat protein